MSVERNVEGNRPISTVEIEIRLADSQRSTSPRRCYGDFFGAYRAANTTIGPIGVPCKPMGSLRLWHGQLMGYWSKRSQDIASSADRAQKTGRQPASRYALHRALRHARRHHQRHRLLSPAAAGLSRVSSRACRCEQRQTHRYVSRSPPDARRTTLCPGVWPPVRRTTIPGATSYSVSRI